jgi:hypothetical protein
MCALSTIHPIFCPDCRNLILDLSTCPACGWQRPLAPGDAGKLAWQGELGRRLGKPRCYPAVAAGRFCAPTEDGAVVALDLATGQVAWERMLGEGRAAFVEYEWSALTLRMENAGYGPARNVTVELVGEFDVEGDMRVAYLLAERPVAREISMRPHREHYGPKVPLKIAVSYEDERGQGYGVVQRQPVHVLRQGAERGGVTPTEIRVSGGQQPSGRAGMASLDEINQQRELLATHRQTLAHLVQQAAMFGGERFAPPYVMHGIREARKNIQRIKKNLRDWREEVDDQANDGDTAISVPSPTDQSPAVVEAVLPDKRALREAIVEKFSLDDLDLLCADVEQDLAADGIALQVSLELVGGSGKPGKVLNLIAYLERRGCLHYLVNAVRRSRPELI